MNEPKKITAGFYYTWTETNSDYLASVGYTLKYSIHNENTNVKISSTADGDDHKIELLSATTESMDAGVYKWTSYAEKSNEKYLIAEGYITIEANPLNDAPVDYRSHARITLDALESAIERRATKEQLSISIAGRSLQYMTMRELIEAKEYYTVLVNGEDEIAKINAGQKPGGRYLVQFEN